MAYINDSDEGIRKIYTIIAYTSTSVTAVFGIACLAAWWLVHPRSDSLLMAPTTAVSFMMLGSALLLKAKGDSRPFVRQSARGITIAVTFFSILVVLQTVAGIELGMEIFFPSADGATHQVPVGSMPIVSAVIFLLSGLAATILVYQNILTVRIKYVSIALSSLPFAAGVLFAAYYLQGTPLLYNGNTIPVDGLTAVGFFTLGLGLHAVSTLQAAVQQQRENALERPSLKRELPAIITLSTGITLAVVLFAVVHGLECKAIQNEFNLDAENYSVALEKGIEGKLNELRNLEGFYGSSPHVTRAAFRTYVNNVLSHNAGIYALQWIPRVARAERGLYESAARKDGFPKFRFTKLNSRREFVLSDTKDEYFPVYFTEPDRENEMALGLDLASLPARKTSLDKARDTGAAVATGRIRLAGEKGSEFAFLALQPLYRNGLPHYSLADRRKNLIGFAAGVFYIRDLAEAALKGINLDGIKISLVDDSAPPEDAALYSNLQHENSAGSILFFFTTLNIADRKWMVQFYPTDQYLSAHKTPYSWTILGGGIGFTILFTLYALKRERYASEIERSNEITATVLNSINAAISIINTKDRTILACNNVFLHETGEGKGDVIGRKCHEVRQTSVLPCVRCGEECVMQRVLETRDHAVSEHLLAGFDGSERHVETSAFPVRDAAGNVSQIVHVSQDITERKQAEKARLQEQEMRRLSAERQVVEAQLRTLQAQIEPHFLFNTLANIVSLVDNEPAAAKQMLQYLTTYLRQSLQRSRKGSSTLGHEADMLRDYLGIFKLRLGTRLGFHINIPQELRELSFPPMLLQPLVENSIIHGIEPKVDGGTITVIAERNGAALRVMIADTGLGFSDLMKAQGIGLENVKSRLQALYADRAGLALEENTPCGVTAVLEVPL
jgi:PAS domain S-box-containing protein